MRITCPHCGERSLDEFVYQGDASAVRPHPARDDAVDVFYVYGYERQNPAGTLNELWYHSAGCHAWLVVTRDTRTHAISSVETAKDVADKRVKRTAGGAS
ncbi:MAG: sarcosine oxidase subunit delta [Hyphomicrobium sp.]